MKIPSFNSRRATISGKPTGRRMAAALSSAEPAQQVFGTEVLVHTAEAIDLSRAANGLPLLVNHESRALPIGRIENIHLAEDQRLRGELVFSDVTQEARDAFALVEDGTLSDVSIRYQINDWQRDGDDAIQVTRWMPVEGSVVSVPADATVGIGRSLTSQESTVSDETTNAAGVGTTPPATPTAPTTDSIIATARERSSASFQAGQRAASERLNEIDGIARTLCRSIPDLAPDMEALADAVRADASITVERFRSMALELIGGQGHPLATGQRDDGTTSPLDAVRAPSQPTAGERLPASRYSPGAAPGNARRPMVSAGPDGLTKACRGMELSMLERAGATLDEKETAGNTYRGWSMLDMARDCLELSGVPTRGMSSERLALAAINQGRGEGRRALDPGTAQYDSTDFPSVTENVMTKRVVDAFAAADVTWSMFCSSTEVPDFKAFTLPQLSQISSLPTVAPNVGYASLTQTDSKETSTLTKQGGLISFTWEALVNDDQRMFSRTAMDLGEAAARTIDEKVYAILTLNPATLPDAQGPVMSDTDQLFNADTHLNVGTTKLDLDGIIEGRTALARQTDSNGQTLGIRLRYLIVPEEKRDDADNLAVSTFLPWDAPSGTGGAQRSNTVRSTFTVVSTVRLSSPTEYYLAGAANQTIEVAFLNGNRNPAIFREEGWNTDSLNWKIRHPSVAYPIDWRGLYFQKATT